MINISDKEKVDILVSALEERYRSIHIIRDRVQNICVWALGLLLGTGAWLLQAEIILSDEQKILIIVAVVVSFVVLRFNYLEDLKKGFANQQLSAARIEKTLGLFTPRFFDTNTEESIYPKSWEKAGEKGYEGKFFSSSFILLYVGLAFIIVAILFNGCFL